MTLAGESLTLPLEGPSWAISVPLRTLGLDCPEQIVLMLKARLRTSMTRNWMMLREAWGG